MDPYDREVIGKVTDHLPLEAAKDAGYSDEATNGVDVGIQKARDLREEAAPAVRPAPWPAVMA